MTKLKYVEALLDGVKQAIVDCNFSIDVRFASLFKLLAFNIMYFICYRLLLSIDRSRGACDAFDTVELAKKFTNCTPCCVVGIDLSGNPEVCLFFPQNFTISLINYYQMNKSNTNKILFNSCYFSLSLVCC